MHLNLRFLADSDDSYPPFEKSGVEVDHCPTVGSCVRVNGCFHRVLDVVHDLEENTILLELGQSAQSPEEARSTGYGIWNRAD